MDQKKAEQLLPIIEFLQKYHRHEVRGINRIPKQGGAILAVNHSLATYDTALLLASIFRKHERMVRSLIDRLFFKVPFAGEFMQELGSREGTRENAKALLTEGEIICVAPGGMRESLRPSAQRYQFMWERRRGFVRISIETGCPIILSACPKADDIFEVYGNKLTAWAYKQFKVPLFVARGFGPTPIPKPVKLVHHLSEPLQPPPAPSDEEELEKLVDKFHKKILLRMKRLMSDAVQFREK